jgi:hypothetical protein
MERGIFFDNGASLAQARIDANDELAENSSLKTVTFKAPDYVVEVLDAFASYSVSTRSALISDILTHYLGQAFVEFAEGYLDNFTSDQPMEYRVQCESYSLIEGLSPNAGVFLTKQVAKVLEG